MENAFANTAKAPEVQDIPNLPALLELADGESAPQAPASLAEVDVDPARLKDLTLKFAYTTFNFTTEWAAQRLHLPIQITEELLQDLVRDTMLQVLGQVGPFTYRYTITQRGAEEAARLLEVSGYVGPAPVSLQSYIAMLDWQISRFPQIRPKEVAAAISALQSPYCRFTTSAPSGSARQSSASSSDRSRPISDRLAQATPTIGAPAARATYCRRRWSRRFASATRKAPPCAPRG